MANNPERLELQRKHIAQVLAQLTTDYQQAKAERQALATQLPEEASGFSLLEELELLTVSIRGFGSQFITSNGVSNQREAVGQLRQMRVFNVPSIAQFYFDMSIDSERLKLYVSLLDYLRLLILEYLQANAAEEVFAA
ncbi:MAG: hypothetical protein AAFY72_05250 [Cyanobacteria bacterium J06649_4]